MCGFIGSMSVGSLNQSEKADIRKMERYVINRGPDQRGEFETESLFFIHRRLSVLGDSFQAQQPMLSSCKNWVLIFNGEIYNFASLAREYNIKSMGSDTRVLVELISRYGIEKTISIVNGMYAFVAINLKEKYCHFSTDYFGQKPLYFAIDGSRITFSSDLSAFTVQSRKINRVAEDYFLRVGYIPKALSFFSGVQKVQPSVLYTFRLGEVTAIPKKRKPKMNVNIDLLAVEKAVETHLVSDHPIFTFLSSGLDSSIVSALAAKHSSIDSFTFSLGNSINDETLHAGKIAKFLGIKNYIVSSEDIDVPSMFENLHTILSEPLGDPAALALHMMCTSVKNFGFKVGLTGDGGDEIFGGYSDIEEQYLKYMRFKKWPVPRFFRKLSIPTKIGREIKRFSLLHDRSVSSKLDLQFLHSAGDFFGYADGAAVDRNEVFELLKANNFSDFYKMQIQNKFAPKLDLASANAGVELRVPLLSDTLVGLTGSRANKIKIYEELIPENLRNYKKLGFGVNLKNMIENGGKGWVYDNVNKSHNFYSKATVRRLKVEAKALDFGLADITFLFRHCQAISWQNAYT